MRNHAFILTIMSTKITVSSDMKGIHALIVNISLLFFSNTLLILSGIFNVLILSDCSNTESLHSIIE